MSTEFDKLISMAATIPLEEAPNMLMGIHDVMVNMIGALYARKLLEVCSCPDCRDATKDMAQFEISKFDSHIKRVIDETLKANGQEPLFVSTTNEKTLNEILAEIEADKK